MLMPKVSLWKYNQIEDRKREAGSKLSNLLILASGFQYWKRKDNKESISFTSIPTAIIICWSCGAETIIGVGGTGLIITLPKGELVIGTYWPFSLRQIHFLYEWFIRDILWLICVDLLNNRELYYTVCESILPQREWGYKITTSKGENNE